MDLYIYIGPCLFYSLSSGTVDTEICRARFFCRVTHTVMVCPAARMTAVVSVSVSTASPSVSKFRMWICHYLSGCQAKVQDGMLRVKITIAAYVRLPCKVSCLVSTLRWVAGVGVGRQGWEGEGRGVGRRRQTVFVFVLF